jgi:Protein of unknown function (DUF2746)
MPYSKKPFNFDIYGCYVTSIGFPFLSFSAPSPPTGRLVVRSEVLDEITKDGYRIP